MVPLAFLDVPTPSQRVFVVAGSILVAGVVAVVVLVSRFDSRHGSLVAPIRPPAANVEGPPRPPHGALVLAREDGTRAVALAVGQGPRPRLTATVLDSTGDARSGLPVSFRIGAGGPLPARSCGRGCYTADTPSGVRLRRVEVVLPGNPVAFQVPASTRPAAAIVARASRVFRRLRSLVYVESLRSGPRGGILTTWRLRAPNEVTYDIREGASAVVIGRTRWDRDRPGGRWTRSQQLPPLRVPQPSWGDVAVNAHVLGTARVAGRPVWVISFANPTVPAWFTVWIDRVTYRTLRLRMTAAAHFMFHRYVGFDRPLVIRPPR
jgi:hypothetical protein